MWTEVRRLQRAQWQRPDELERTLADRVRALCRHASRHVPYYRDLFRRAGIGPDDIRTVSDLRQLPITTKADLKAGFPEATSADNIPPPRRRLMRTSGSTGLPLEFFEDKADADLRLGAYLFSLEWAGTALWHTRVAIIVPSWFATNTPPTSRLRALGRRVMFGEETRRLPAESLTLDAFTTLIRGIRRPYFIRGYPSAIGHLAGRLLQAGATLPVYPQTVITYAETLTPANAAAIGEALRCRISNYYTTWDVPHVAQTCPDHPRLLHVPSDRVVVRVVRADGAEAEPGEAGHVVVTDLSNHVMPFINYLIGDDAVAGGPCPCGRGFPTLAAIEGRTTELLRTPSGKQVSGSVLGHYLAFVVGVIPFVWEYQAIQQAPEAVTLRVVPTSRFSEPFAKRLLGAVETFLGPGVTVSLELADRIPVERSGKRLIIKSLPTATERAGERPGSCLTPPGSA